IPAFPWIVRRVQHTRWFVRSYPGVIRRVLLHPQALTIIAYIIWGPPRSGPRGLYNARPDRRMFERSWKSI
ncbi:hypothetical protein M405DRAFT_826920, partial [Rhizopogon salebrosus TDB-379]